MLFQIYGDLAGFQLLGWLLVFAGLIITNEIARRSKQGGIFFYGADKKCQHKHSEQVFFFIAVKEKQEQWNEKYIFVEIVKASSGGGRGKSVDEAEYHGTSKAKHLLSEKNDLRSRAFFHLILKFMH